jgi:hypothetical protein
VTTALPAAATTWAGWISTLVTGPGLGPPPGVGVGVGDGREIESDCVDGAAAAGTGPGAAPSGVGRGRSGASLTGLSLGGSVRRPGARVDRHLPGVLLAATIENAIVAK